MDAINARLQQLEDLEIALLAEREHIVNFRAKEDQAIVGTRAKEDEEWKKRIVARDSEEDNLRLRKRELSRLWNSSTSISGDAKGSPLSTVSLHRSGQVYSPATIKQEDTPIKSSRKRKTTSSAPRKKRRPDPGSPQTTDAEGPLYLRQSDNKLVHLYCCVIGCNEAHFKNVTSLISHIASPRYHGFGNGYLLKDHSDAIEKCGRLPGDADTENFFQVPPRVFPPRHTGRRIELTPDDACKIIPTSLLRIGEAGVFGKMTERITDPPTLEPENGKETAYSSGVSVLSLEEEAGPRYVQSSQSSIHESPSTEAGSETPTRFPDSGNQVPIKEESKDEPKDEPKDELATARDEQLTPR